ncbi:hypothetical protein Tco_1008385, partial [Tanacetum coccineum]
MSWFSRCSWCRGPINGRNCRRCTNVSFRDEFVRNPDPIYNDETPDFSYPPSQPQTSSFDQFHCFHCGDSLKDGVRCQRCTCKWCGHGLREGFCLFCASRDENASIDAPNPNSFNNLPNVFNHPPQPQYESYSYELCGNDSHYGYDCTPWFPLVYEQEPSYNQNFSDNYYPQNSLSFPQQYLCCENCGGPHESFQCQPMNQNHFEHNSNSFGFDQYQSSQYFIDHQEDLNQQRWEESKNEHLNMMRSFSEMVIQRKQVANIDQSHPQEMITPKPLRRFNFTCNDDEEYSIPLNKMPQILRSIAPAPVPSTIEPEDSLIMGDEHLSTISEKESDEVIKSSVEDLVPIPKDFTSSDNESLSEEDVPKETFKIYSNPLFEFDDDFTFSDVNPLFNEVLEDVESEDSFDSKLAKPTFLISPLSDANKDECFDPGGDEIDAFLDLDISTEIENDFHDSEGDIIFLEKLLINNTFLILPSEVFLDHDPRSLKDEPNFVDMVQVFDPG